ncbi:hypothetical protein RI065_01925 [Mycoplasmatota bacterium zrk1]
MNSKYLLSAFHAETIVLQKETIEVSVELEEIFEDEYGIFMYNESLISRIQNLNKEHYLKLYFYKDDKLLLKLKMYELEEHTSYSGDINGTPVVVKWNGLRLEYHDEFYENIEKILSDKLD